MYQFSNSENLKDIGEQNGMDKRLDIAPAIDLLSPTLSIELSIHLIIKTYCYP